MAYKKLYLYQLHLRNAEWENRNKECVKIESIISVLSRNVVVEKDGKPVEVKGVFYKDQFGQTAIHNAAEKNNICTVKAAVSLGADVNAKDIWNTTALSIAAGKNHSDIVIFLLKNKAEPQNLVIGLAIRNQTELLKDMLEITKEGINAKDQFGQTALHQAAREDHALVAKILVDNKIDTHAKNLWGDTAYDLAIDHKKFKMALYLKEQGVIGTKASDLLLEKYLEAQHNNLIASPLQNVLVEDNANQNPINLGYHQDL